MHKILFVATIAGTLRAFLLPFADHFRSRGWQVDAVAKGVADCAECKKYFDNVYDIPWSRSLLAPENWLRAPRRITQIVRDGRYDLVHVHTPIAAAISRHALRKIRLNRGLKVIYTAHGLHFSGDKKASSDKIFVLAEKLAAKWTDYLIVMNQEDYNSVLKYKIAAESQLIYMPGIGVDTNFYKSERPKKNQKERFKQDLGLVSEDKYFLIVAEFNKRKHHDHAIRALSMLGKTDVHLVLAGEGPLKDDMRRLAQRLGIGAQVHFLGFRRDIPRLMQFSNGLILPSSREGLPRCVMEAMSVGIPCIGANVRGTYDLLKGDAGILYNVGDIRGLADAMSAVIKDDGLVQRLTARARERVTSFDTTEIIRLHDELYDRVLDEHSVGAGIRSQQRHE